jgi:hypothetical protein
MFLNFLPNLRVFKYKTGDLSNNDEEFFSQPFKHLMPNTRLREVKNGGTCEFTRQLTSSGTCTRLELLNIAVSGHLINPGKDLYPYLKNMPILKKLTLKYADIGIQDCEVLHNNLPSLESFNLKDVNLKAGPLPRNISPATSLNTLCYTFNDVQNNADYPNWYLYMTKKYPNLKSLVADDYNLPNAGSEEVTIIYRDGILPLYKIVVNAYTISMLKMCQLNYKYLLNWMHLAADSRHVDLRIMIQDLYLLNWPIPSKQSMLESL